MIPRPLILFAHGARDPEWARPVQAVAAKLRVENPDQPVLVAFLEFMSPTLPEAVSELIASAPEPVPALDILPFFIAQGGHLRQEVPLMLEEIQRRHPGTSLRLLPPLGELPSVQAAMAQAITSLLK